MEITPEQREAAKVALAAHLANMGYGNPNADSPSYEMNIDEPLTIVQAAIASHKFHNPHQQKEN